MWQQLWHHAVIVLCHAAVEVNRFTSDVELLELTSRVLRRFLVTLKSSEQKLIQILSVCLCLLRRRCSGLNLFLWGKFTQFIYCKKCGAGFFLGRTLVFCLIWPLLLKLRICTYGWNFNMMKWKAEIFLLGIILLLMWNLLSSTRSCSLCMCQISDSLVSVLVFELFMCVATHSKCY